MRTLPRAMAALVTPFSRSGAVDLRAHAANVTLMWERGMPGVLVGGSTGEGPYLEPGERQGLVEAARNAAPRAFVLCGVHAESLRIAQGCIAEAAAGGADAALVMTPTTLVRQRPELIERFYLDLAEASPLPLMLYSFPRLAGVEIGESSVASLAALPGIVGMKDSGGDPIRAGRLADTAPSDFFLFAGATAAISLSMAGGAYGAITASANYAPRLMRDTVAAARRSLRSAAAFQTPLTRTAATIERHGIPGTKYAARQTGLATGGVRRPLQPLSPAARAEIRVALRAAGLI